MQPRNPFAKCVLALLTTYCFPSMLSRCCSSLDVRVRLQTCLVTAYQPTLFCSARSGAAAGTLLAQVLTSDLPQSIPLPIVKQHVWCCQTKLADNDHSSKGMTRGDSTCTQTSQEQGTSHRPCSTLPLHISTATQAYPSIISSILPHRCTPHSLHHSFQCSTHCQHRAVKSQLQQACQSLQTLLLLLLNMQCHTQLRGPSQAGL